MSAIAHRVSAIIARDAKKEGTLQKRPCDHPNFTDRYTSTERRATRRLKRLESQLQPQVLP